jgi:hypothetical protein
MTAIKASPAIILFPSIIQATSRSSFIALSVQEAHEKIHSR